MLNQKSLNFTKTTNHNNNISQLIKKDFKDIENNDDNKNNFLTAFVKKILITGNIYCY